MKPINERIKTTTFLTDGGLETDLIFIKNIDLPHFAAFPLLDNPKHLNTLRAYFMEYMEIAKQKGTGYILESPTWRANTDWGYKLGYSRQDLFGVNQKAIELLKELKETFKDDINDILISGQIGPRGDGYQIGDVMSEKEAQKYHSLQVEAFKKSDVDMVSAITMTYTEEAVGVSLAAQEYGLPIVISFTVETDGKLPNGDSLEEAIYKVDNATNDYPLYYMINCAHPTHFISALEGNQSWKSRIKGIRANASCKSHSELDESTELDAGNSIELGQWHNKLKMHLPELAVYGGCCGTDASHIESICNHVL
jgi:S-methylmethionine-dependent homocysteine/selenocysteine methylase